MKLVSVVGARPQFIKLAPMIHAIRRLNEEQGLDIQHFTIHTGQHYDHGMSDIFFEELEIPPAEYNLGVGSGKHGEQTGKMLAGIEDLLLELQPDMLIIFGDTNSTVAAALAAAKIHIPIAHVEAGLRSFNRRMPEEINRIASDHLSDILLAPTPTAVTHLKREGLEAQTVLTGDIMYDTVLYNKQLSDKKSTALADLGLEAGQFALATVHRPSNTDNVERLEALLNFFNEIAATHFPVVFPMHPRTAHRLPGMLPNWKAHPNLKLIEPVGYLDMLQLLGNARLAFTDSGGLQKEAFFLSCPCITLRDETEWVETVMAGANIIVGADQTKIRKAFEDWQIRLAEGPVDFRGEIPPYFGHGDAADRIMTAIIQFLKPVPQGAV